MLKYPFKNYSEFKTIFGIIHHGNGHKSRSNKILLSLFKSGTWIFNTPLIECRDMPSLKKTALSLISEEGFNSETLYHKCNLMEYAFWSDRYATDDWKGICEDSTINFIRYINCETNKVFKMRAGKFMRDLIECTQIGQRYPEQLKNWLCEEFVSDWTVYVKGQMPDVKLVIDQDFKKVYSYKQCQGDFGSCMQSDHCEHWKFYRDSVEAHAAYLVNNTGIVIARAIIYDEISDEHGNTYRGLERQYASEESEFLKRLLIQKCIEAGAIDIYKKCGAGCREATAWVDLDGNSLSHKTFSIECNIDWNDHLSYQDSFKWLQGSTAFNQEPDCFDYDLDRTDSYLDSDEDEDDDDDYEEDDENYDDYRNEYTSDEVYRVYMSGNLLYTAEPFDDFCQLPNGEWHHEDDVIQPEDSDDYYLKEDSRLHYSNLLCEYYLDATKLKENELAYMKEHWHYSEIEDEYFEYSRDITHVYLWNEEDKCYIKKTVSFDYADAATETGKYYQIDGYYFDNLDPETNLPFGYHLNTNSKTVSNNEAA